MRKHNTGSTKPRPARPGHERPGRPPDIWRFTEPPSTSDLIAGSAFHVEGRAIVRYWDGPKRESFRRLGEIAAGFGLQVVETNIPEGGRVRKAWDHKRVDLEFALATIKDLPGILFDEWLKIYLAGVPETPPALSAARKKAAAALHRLYHDAKVDKRYADDGRLILYQIGKAPPGLKMRPGNPAKEN